METEFLDEDNNNSPLLPNNHEYRQAIGSLLYLATISRPDVSAVVGCLARRIEAPNQADWNAVKRIIRFLNSTKHYKLYLSSDSNGVFCYFVDADWAGDTRNRKSTFVHIFQLGPNTYVAVADATKELQWLRYLLIDMKIFFEGAIPLFEDKQWCMKLITLDKSGKHTKHIDVCYHQIRHFNEQGIIDVQYVLQNKL